jgi:UDPglucose--hexose-1-phosphate uridylyltransferase
MISSYLQGRASRNAAHYQQHSCSLIQSLTNWERDQGHRILEQTEHFTALCPYASQYAYQVWIVPKPTAGDFLNCSSAVRDELALFSQRLVKAIETLLEEPAYNMLFQIAPFGDDSVPAAEQPWYIEIIPRTTNAAGFELGTDVWVNPVAPETAAQSLKACLAQLTPVE